MQIGDKVWIFDSNRRIYKDEKGDKTQAPWYRGHFVERHIIGETKQSWIVGYEGNHVDSKMNIKVNKKNLTYSNTNSYGLDGKLYISEEEIDRKCWMNNNHREIVRQLERCRDYDKLKKIEEILSL